MALKKAANAGQDPLVAATRSQSAADPPPVVKKMVSARVDVNLRNEFKMVCLQSGVTLEEAFDGAMRAWIKEHREPPQPPTEV